MEPCSNQRSVKQIIVKWKHLWATTAQPLKPHKLTERDRQVLKSVVHKTPLSSVETLTTEFRTASGSNVSTRTVSRELHEMVSMAEQIAHKPKITTCNDKRRLEWCKAHGHRTLEKWKRVLTLHHLAVQQTNLGLADARRMLPAPMHSANCKVWWRRNNDLGLFFMVWTRPHSSSEIKL
jgi:arginine repressor